MLRCVSGTLQHNPITLYLHNMVRSLITFLILILSCHTIGGFKGGYGPNNNCLIENSYFNRSATIFYSIEISSMPDPDHAEKENGNDDILEIPSFDMGCYRSSYLLKTTIDQDNNNSYTEFYIRHYPWVVTEVNTPPPKI